MKDLESRLASEVTALHAATEKYTTALQEHLNRKTEISRLRIHVKDNILYYMQAIWNHEPPDQRFFRLYNKQTLWIGTPAEGYRGVAGDALGNIDFEVPAEIPVEFKTLEEIANLDNLLATRIIPSWVNRAILLTVSRATGAGR